MAIPRIFQPVSEAADAVLQELLENPGPRSGERASGDRPEGSPGR